MKAHLPLILIVAFAVLVVVFPPAAWLLFLGVLGAAVLRGDAARG